MLTAVVIALAVAIVIIAAVAFRSWRKPAARVEPANEAGAAGRRAPAGEAQPRLEGVVPVPPVPLVPGLERAPPLPVVLVHGLFGFDRIGIPGARFDYFRGIARHLGTLGCHAHAVRLPAAGSVPDRARELVAAINALPHPRVDLIAHSLGGLDARYALSHLGLSGRVRALVTVGTPHHGTPLADLALRGPIDWLRRLIHAAGIPLAAIEWLSPTALSDFNARVPDAPGVRYACVVGGMHRDDSFVPFALAPAHAYLRRLAGRNDGLVPIASQYWGETLAEIEADHFAQIGWRVAMRSTFDAPGLYAFIVSRLGDPAGLGGVAAEAVAAGAGTGAEADARDETGAKTVAPAAKAG